MDITLTDATGIAPCCVSSKNLSYAELNPKIIVAEQVGIRCPSVRRIMANDLKKKTLSMKTEANRFL